MRNTPKITHDISLLGYLVSAMLVGYIAGALNKRSFSLSKMLISGIIAGLVGSLFLFLTYQVSPFAHGYWRLWLVHHCNSSDSDGYCCAFTC